jgi:hypothetical protein
MMWCTDARVLGAPTLDDLFIAVAYINKQITVTTSTTTLVPTKLFLTTDNKANNMSE